jgi:hypothetical protein
VHVLKNGERFAFLLPSPRKMIWCFSDLTSRRDPLGRHEGKVSPPD